MIEQERHNERPYPTDEGWNTYHPLVPFCPMAGQAEAGQHPIIGQQHTAHGDQQESVEGYEVE